VANRGGATAVHEAVLGLGVEEIATSPNGALSRSGERDGIRHSCLGAVFHLRRRMSAWSSFARQRLCVMG